MTNDGVLGPFPGFTVSQEALQLEGISFDDVKRAFADLKTQQQRVDTMLRENDDLTAEVERLRGNWTQAERELARVAAVLATTRENVETLVQAVGERYITQAAVCTILAAQRSLAGLVVTP